MPFRPPHPCPHPGCPALTHERYCPAHTKLRRDAYESTRLSAFERGYDRSWQKIRKAFLAENPFCARCLAYGKRNPATVVDHRVPHHGNRSLFYDVENWQALCKPCHDSKTAREDGRWGGGGRIPADPSEDRGTPPSARGRSSEVGVSGVTR